MVSPVQIKINRLKDAKISHNVFLQLKNIDTNLVEVKLFAFWPFKVWSIYIPLFQFNGEHNQ